MTLPVGGSDGIGVLDVVRARGPALLVLDNCEQVVRGVADLVQALVSRTRDLRILTTSRAPLGLSSETVHALPELDTATTVELFENVLLSTIGAKGWQDMSGDKLDWRGAKTRTWFTLPDQEVFAVAGLWRDTPEWGPAYSMVMTEACIHVQGVHDRMPVILNRDTWGDWLDGPPDAARLSEECLTEQGSATAGG